MTISEARELVGARVVYVSFSGMELHGEIRYAGGQFVFVQFDREMIAKATAPELIELEEVA